MLIWDIGYLKQNLCLLLVLEYIDFKEERLQRRNTFIFFSILEELEEYNFFEDMVELTSKPI